MTKLAGSCVCNDLAYRVNGRIKAIVNCHCNLCRKMNGAAFSTYVVVADTDFELLRGELQSFKVSDKSTKTLCARCGTPVFNTNPEFAELKILHLGSLDTSAELAPQLNIYCESQLKWLEKLGQLDSFKKGLN